LLSIMINFAELDLLPLRRPGFLAYVPTTDAKAGGSGAGCACVSHHGRRNGRV
jgi:hypothetical protein